MTSVPAFMAWILACFALSLSGCTASTTHHAPPAAASPIEDEPTAAEAARALTMGSLPEAHDCDSNGLPDSLDVRAGRNDDVNHDGVDDYCDDDPEVRRRAWSNDWRKLAAARDTAALLVRHQSGDEVWIAYTVPSEGAAIRLLVRAPSGRIVKTLLDRHARSGAYDVVWNQTDDRGRPVADSTTYSISLEFGRHIYTRPVLWHHTR